MRARYRQILIFCPDAVSGGPEALHQLAHVLNRHGATARMVYYGKHSTLHMRDDVIVCGVNMDSPVHAAYRAYDAPPLRHCVVTPDTLLVLPEGLIELAVSCLTSSVARIALWWLSVDNSPLAKRPPDPAFEAALFRSRIIHFYQSHYAYAMLRERGAANACPLFDYTDPAFVRDGLGFLTPDAIPRGRSIAFYPAKAGEAGRDFLTGLMNRDPGLSVVALRDMTKAQVGEALRSCRIFIDFGHGPGKDRIPREAAILGAVIVVRRAGAANFFNDYPLDARFLFSDDELGSGTLEDRLHEIFADPDRAVAEQGTLRHRVALEYEEFSLQVRQWFFVV